jgi:hypothetical protein
MVYRSKLPSLGLSRTLAYNMNIMASLIELWVSLHVFSVLFYRFKIALIQIQCSDMRKNTLGNGQQQIVYNIPNKKPENCVRKVLKILFWSCSSIWPYWGWIHVTFFSAKSKIYHLFAVVSTTSTNMKNCTNRFM